jgi:hypothetical protein
MAQIHSLQTRALPESHNHTDEFNKHPQTQLYVSSKQFGIDFLHPKKGPQIFPRFIATRLLLDSKACRGSDHLFIQKDISQKLAA